MVFVSTALEARRGSKSRRRQVNNNMAATAFGYCLMAVSLTFERSAAFVVGGAPGAFAGRAIATSSSSSTTYSSSTTGGAAAAGRIGHVGFDGRQRRRTSSRLSMEIMSKPVKNKQKSDKGTKKNPDVNEEITVETVRCVISVKGMDEPLGIMSTSEALDRAQEEGLDLVMISPDADPPVVKIIDYGKFKYKSDKKRKDSKAKAKSTEMKEVKMSYKIEQHDYDVRIKNAKKFVTQGNRVRVIVQFRGREQSHMDLGTVLLDKVIKDMDGLANAEPKRREGNRLSMILFPKIAQQ